MGKIFKFWTKKEVDLLRIAYESNNTIKKAIESLKDKINRTPASIAVRLNTMYGKKRVPKVDNKAISLPKGFSFDLKPDRVVLFKDKVEIYF